MSDLDVPDKYDDWPFDAKNFVLAEANTALELRHEIEALAGMEKTDEEGRAVSQFSKDEMATIVMALGGPRGEE